MFLIILKRPFIDVITSIIDNHQASLRRQVPVTGDHHGSQRVKMDKCSYFRDFNF